MSRYLTWLHLSDLHYYQSKTGWDAARILQTIIKDLKRMYSDHGLRPDLIFFTGDAAFGHINDEPEHNIEGQFDGAHRFFEEVRSAFEMEVPHTDFFLVPGNHDVNRHCVSADQTEWLDKLTDVTAVESMLQSNSLQWRRYMERLASYRNFLEKYEYVHLLAAPRNLTYSARRKIHGIEIGIVGLNSAWSCGRDNEKGKLWMGGRWQIENALTTLASSDLKIALVHHPFNWITEYEDPRARRQIERDFDFCLHGHEHQEWVERTENHIKIAAGACYDTSNRENSYNFVRINLETGDTEVWLRRYHSDGGDWIPEVIPRKTNNDGLWLLTNLPKIIAVPATPRPEVVANASVVESAEAACSSTSVAPNRASGVIHILNQHSPEAQSAFSMHSQLAKVLDLHADVNCPLSYAIASDGLINEELGRAARAFKLGLKDEALTAVFAMWRQLSRRTPFGGYWARKAGLLAAKFLREIGRYDESLSVYNEVICHCDGNEPDIHIEALSGIMLTRSMLYPGQAESLRPIRSQLQAVIDSYFPERRANRLTRLNALSNLYRDSVSLELAEGPAGISKHMELTDTMKLFLLTKEEIYDPYILARNAEVSARIYTYSGMLERANEQLEESEHHHINLVGQMYTIDSVRFQRVRAMMLAREGKYEEALEIAHKSLVSCTENGFKNFENKMREFSVRLQYLFRNG